MRVGELKLNYKTGVIRLTGNTHVLTGLSVADGLKLTENLGWFEIGFLSSELATPSPTSSGLSV